MPPRYRATDGSSSCTIHRSAFTAAMFVAGLIWQGSSLEGGLTYFSWLLQAGATGILPVYALVK